MGRRKGPGFGGRMKRKVKRIEGREDEELAGHRECLMVGMRGEGLGGEEAWEDSGAFSFNEWRCGWDSLCI